jgi:protein-glutamine gamma-glutamyltransferase
MAMNTAVRTAAPRGLPAHLPRWLPTRLPREARDTLFLLAVVGWTVLPHVPQLPLWCSLLALMMLLWRGALALRGEPLPSRWVVVAILLLAAGLTWWSHRTLLGREAGVTLVVVLAAMKTLELRARRDAFVVFFLGFFLVLTNFLYSQSLLTAVAMLVSVWGLLTALVLAHMPVGQPALRAAGALALRTALLGAPVMALLFVLFPRVAPLWGVPTDAIGRTGLSATMKLGAIAELAQDDTVAMRVRFEGGVPVGDQLYFRGPVLSRFDGIEWRMSEAVFQPRAGFRAQGTALRYEMTVEPLRVPTLPLLEITAEEPRVDGADPGFFMRRREDLNWFVNRIITDRLRVQAVAYPSHRHGPTQRVSELSELVQLPPGVNPRLTAWAREFRARTGDAGAEVIAGALLAHIRSGGYIYTLAPGEYGANLLDEFWLDRKEGFCEHFAAAFVVAMRAMDIPARVVTGYQGGEFNPIDGFLEVRNSDAHAWAEYWTAARGWVRVDPTAAVAPDRIQRGQRLVPTPGLLASAIGSVNPNLLSQLRALWSAMDNRWNQWVLNYSRGKQLDLLRTLGVEQPSLGQVGYLLFLTVSVLALAGALWAWWEQHRIDPWLRAHRRAVRALAARGVASAAHLPPRALAERALAVHGEAARALVQHLLALEAVRYGRVSPLHGGAGRWRIATLARRLAAQIERAAGTLPKRAPSTT